MGKLLFFDIDGTLIDGKTDRIPDSAIEGLTKAHENGHLLFINTGRCKSFVQDCLSKIPFDGFAYACGAHIEYRGETLFEKFVDAKDIDYIRDAMCRTGLQGIFQGPEFCYFDQEAEWYDNLKKFARLYDTDYHTVRKDFYADANDMVVNKLVTFRTEDCDYAGFLKLMGDRYQLIDNGGGFTEILPLPYTKATCMDYLMDYFGLTPDDCYVFGDSPNDLPMMTHIKNSICLGNGYDSVKAISGYVTTDIDKDGIWLALKHYHLI